jgi:hypothetical protein
MAAVVVADIRLAKEGDTEAQDDGPEIGRSMVSLGRGDREGAVSFSWLERLSKKWDREHGPI